ncbi:MAG: hypothetical protein AAF628_24020 [Planctomycetota bacterium]
MIGVRPGVGRTAPLASGVAAARAGRRLRPCGGVRKVLAFVMAAAAVRRVLAHLGKPLEAPVVAPARGPPDVLPLG